MTEFKKTEPDKIVDAIRLLANSKDDDLLVVAAMIVGLDDREFTGDELSVTNKMLHTDISMPCAMIENIFNGRFQFVIDGGEWKCKLTDFGRESVRGLKREKSE